MKASSAGYVFAIPCLFFALSAFLVTYIVARVPRRLFIFLSFVGVGFSLFMMGPSDLLHFPDKLWLLILGLALNGVV